MTHTSINFPVRLAYQWLVIFGIIIAVPIVWLVLFDAFSLITAFFMDTFPASFTGKNGAAASFQYTIWYFFLVASILASIIWLINETLKERRREAYEIE